MTGDIFRKTLIALVLIFGLVVVITKAARGLAGDDLAFVVIGTELMIVGSVLVIRVPNNRVSWLVFLLGATSIVVGGFELWAPNVSDLVSGVWLWGVLLPGFAGFLPLWFPTGGPPSSRWRWVGLLYGPSVFLILGGTLYAYWFENLDTYDLQCVSPGSCLAIAGLILLLLMGVAAIISFVTRWRRSFGVERQQLMWLTPAFIVLGVGLLAEFTFFQDSLVADVGGGVGAVSIPILIGFAIARYRLYEIDRIVSRTLGYSLVVGILALVFATGAVWLPTRLVGDEVPPVFVAGSTLLVIMLFNPVRTRLLAWVDKRFYRSRYDAERVIDELSGRLRDVVDSQRLADICIGVVTETMRPATVGIWVRS